MKKILIAFGAVILAAAAVFASKPYTTITTIYYTISGVCSHIFLSSTTVNFTTGGIGQQQATIKTAITGNTHALWGRCSGIGPSIPVYFHP